MTEREWLNSLSDEDFTQEMYKGLKRCFVRCIVR